MRDVLALWCLLAARRLTTWGFTHDLLSGPINEQRAIIRYNREPS